MSLSQVTLLLPTATKNTRVSYLLEAYGACAKWEVTNEKVVSLRVITDGCSMNYGKSVLVTSNWEEDRRTSTHIRAELQGSPNVWAECQVFVDKIHRLDILTSTKVVYIGEVEDLKVLAKDSKENVFSTVQGLPFQWTTPTPELENYHR
eukprot:UN04861